MAIRLKLFGTTAAHAELSRDLDQVRNEVISVANECGNGLLWVERVQVATLPTVDRSGSAHARRPGRRDCQAWRLIFGRSGSHRERRFHTGISKEIPIEVSDGADPIVSRSGCADRGSLKKRRAVACAAFSFGASMRIDSVDLIRFGHFYEPSH